MVRGDRQRGKRGNRSMPQRVSREPLTTPRAIASLAVVRFGGRGHLIAPSATSPSARDHPTVYRLMIHPGLGRRAGLKFLAGRFNDIPAVGTMTDMLPKLLIHRRTQPMGEIVACLLADLAAGQWTVLRGHQAETDGAHAQHQHNHDGRTLANGSNPPTGAQPLAETLQCSRRTCFPFVSGSIRSNH